MAAALLVPDLLRRERQHESDGREWLERLPELVSAACATWSLEVTGSPFPGGTCAWVAPVRTDGVDAVLKVTWPHSEAAAEAAALRWWDGHGAVRLLAEDSDAWTMLLEPCRPGTPLRDAGLPVGEAVTIGAGILRALWGRGPSATGFDEMLEVCDAWAALATARVEVHGPALVALDADPGLMRLGIDLLRSLPRSADQHVIVHGDFNPGNLLAAERSPFLAIDPKPMSGDPAYDPWQLVSQLGEPGSGVRTGLARIADQLGLPPERIAAWGIARTVEGGLWAAARGDVASGARWIRSAAAVAPLLDRHP